MKGHDQKVLDRFWAKVDRSDSEGCWLWTAGGDKQGYGHFSVAHGKHTRAHIFSWMLVHGDMPNKLCVLHTCDTPACVNPDHLFLGTRKDNADDKTAKGRTPKGEQHWRNKLTDDQVQNIRHKFEQDRISSTVLSEQYRVTPVTILNAIRGISHAHVPGATNARATYIKLTDDQVRAIRTKYAHGARVSELAREYNVHQSNISKIISGASRTNVQDQEESNGTETGDADL
jgi:hypothetical protein